MFSFRKLQNYFWITNLYLLQLGAIAKRLGRSINFVSPCKLYLEANQIGAQSNHRSLLVDAHLMHNIMAVVIK
ncbi:MAG: hypothetical protein HXY43_21225 [Fischerella sp.]|uniref:hypothetical protein n=1 Tax=Fischerella sp. TaxID=1191 RepID=UPI0017E8D41F|nr:hypothetical protein [Fischerella sp.]NWF61704.1 hypothetical protein [Fischerella sp.]